MKVSQLDQNLNTKNSSIPVRKRKTISPCNRCGLNAQLCICLSIPELNTRSRIDLLVHYKELKRTTNTGRLVCSALVNGYMWIRGEQNRPRLSSVLQANYQPLILFPAGDATEITNESWPLLHRKLNPENKPIQLIVPDGNWRQASKVLRRHDWLKDVEKIFCCPSKKFSQNIRAESTVTGMATLQAVAEVLKIVESVEIGDRLLEVYQNKLRATMQGRGKRTD